MNKSKRNLLNPKALAFLILVVSIMLTSLYFTERSQQEKRLDVIYNKNLEKISHNLGISVKIKDSVEVSKNVSNSILLNDSKYLKITTSDGFVLFSKGKSNCNHNEFYKYNISYNRNIVGYLETCIEINNVFSSKSSIYLVSLNGIFIIVTLIFIFYVFSLRAEPLFKVAEAFKMVDMNNLSLNIDEKILKSNTDLVLIYERVQGFLQDVKKVTKDAIENETKAKQLENEQVKVNLKNEINKQIAHDIRSPLEALKSIATNLDSLDFNTKRIISNSIGRISDIANGLLKSGNEKNEGKSLGNLRILLDDIVHDKSFEHNINIKYDAKAEYRNSYIVGNENTLYRSLSNLVNNAVEAQSNSDVYVKVSFSGSKYELIIEVEDHGPGMDDTLIQKVLEGGYTTKDKGNGLGLSYAKAITEDHGGRLVIISNPGVGTKIQLSFPKVETPTWFVDEFIINKETTLIVCVDDDLSFLALYKEKFKATNKEVITLTSPDVAKFIDDKNIQFFFDYDLGREKTGLDFIIEKKLAEFSTLVTSMHQDEDIQRKCVELGIRMMPKQIFNNSNVKLIDKEKSFPKEEEVVFIDDDQLMHMSWQMEASKSDINLKVYFSVDEFLLQSDAYKKDTKIFIDSNLGEGIKGEIESEKIFNRGFTKIYLATGYSPEDIDKPSWIIDIVGKRADFKKI